jgi:hypothetical protein
MSYFDPPDKTTWIEGRTKVRVNQFPREVLEQKRIAVIDPDDDDDDRKITIDSLEKLEREMEKEDRDDKENE